MNLLISLGVLALSQTALAADFQSPGKVPSPTSPMNEIADWATSIDYLGSRSMPKKRHSSDVITAFGSIINGETCLEGKSEVEKNAFVNALEKSLSETALRLSRCYDFYGFHEIPDAWATIRRTTYTCEKFPNDTPVYDSEKQTFVQLGFEIPLGKEVGAQSLTQTMWSGYQFRWVHFIPTVTNFSEIVYSAQSMNFNVTLLTPEKYDRTTLSKRLFHESLHFLKTANTSWHNDVGRSSDEVASFDYYLRDRVYFMADACMPVKKNFISDLYQIAALRPEMAYSVCKSALTGIDPFLEKAPQMNAIPYARHEAEAICTKIETIGKNIRKQAHAPPILENFIKFLKLE